MEYLFNASLCNVFSFIIIILMIIIVYSMNKEDNSTCNMFSHKWSKWEEPRNVYKGNEHIQWRHCEKCNVYHIKHKKYKEMNYEN